AQSEYIDDGGLCERFSIRYGRENSLRCNFNTLGKGVYLSKLTGVPIESITRLHIVCNHASSKHSSLQGHHLEGFTHLRELSLDHCRIAELRTGTFNGLSTLRNLTLRTYNSEKTVTSLVIPPLLF
ncbi:unnamed protein product, partial [Meganyctiphanes norvegica]